MAAYIMGVAPARIGRELYMVRHVKELLGIPDSMCSPRPRSFNGSLTL